jgi:hypothetical protein
MGLNAEISELLGISFCSLGAQKFVQTVNINEE